MNYGLKVHHPNTWKTIITIALLVSVLPLANAQTVLADSATLRWERVDTPGSVLNKNDLCTPSEVNWIAIGPDSKTMYVIDIPGADPLSGKNALYKSIDAGISWDDLIGINLYRHMSAAEKANYRLWDMAIAPDDSNFIAVVTNNDIDQSPRNIWISTDGGQNWSDSTFHINNLIGAIDISMENNGRTIIAGTRPGDGSGDIYAFETRNMSNWTSQNFSGDILALKFSPAYTSDSTIAVVYSTATGTFLTAGVHDPRANTTGWTHIYNTNPPELMAGNKSSSPEVDQVISASLDLPADFSGRNSSLRRYYVSLDAQINGGIYRFDDTTGYCLLPSTSTKRISNIDYFGTCESGKLIAGEVLGDPCTASVMTWYTDTPQSCSNPCWYSSRKPPTGAAGSDNCTGTGYGNAQVHWSLDGKVVYAGTASSDPLVTGNAWAVPYLTGKDNDESAFSLSRNNGETWNQISLIDTNISEFVDIAPSSDCSNVYLASINTNIACSGFDSVWRSKSSPIGRVWERILCRPTTHLHCASGQTESAILALAGDKRDGQVLFWTAVGTKSLWWSTNYGDYWTQINPTITIRDMAAEDSSTIYIVNDLGQVQKHIRRSAGWFPSPIISSELETGYSIATAFTGSTPDNDKGHVIVGGTGSSGFDVAFSTDGGETFTPVQWKLPTSGNTLVIASSSYNSDGTILAINSGGMYAWGIYSGQNEWEAWWGGPSWPSPVTSLAISKKYGFYFATPGSLWSQATPYVRWSSATAFLDTAVELGTDSLPTRRMKICGGLEFGEPITVWTIDQRPYAPPVGGLWRYVDTLAWFGPSPVAPTARSAINIDPVTGRATEINMQWRPRSLSRGYKIQIAKDRNFSQMVAEIGAGFYGPFYTPHDLDNPALVIPPGGGKVTDKNGNEWNVQSFETGHVYYWRVRVEDVVYSDHIKSPWSVVDNLIVMEGFAVSSSVLGPQLLYPENGQCSTFETEVNFSWSPYPSTTKYRFELSEYPDMSSPILSVDVPTSAYLSEGALKDGSYYFWRVMTIEPQPSEWSSIFTFRNKNPQE